MAEENRIGVSFREFDGQGNCVADITLPNSGIRLAGFKVKPGAGKGVMVYMPPWMYTRWSYPEIQWSEVRRIVTEEYLKAVAGRPFSEIHKAPPEKPHCCTFYSIVVKTEVSVDAYLIPSGEHIQGINLVHSTNEKNDIRVHMPREMNNHWDHALIKWNELAEIIKSEYKRQILNENSGDISEKARIEFWNLQETTTCMADVTLPNKKNPIKGFFLRKTEGNRKPFVSAPKWMGRWNDSSMTWPRLCSLISSEFLKYEAEQKTGPDSPPAQDRESTAASVTPAASSVPTAEPSPAASTVPTAEPSPSVSNVSMAEPSPTASTLSAEADSQDTTAAFTSRAVPDTPASPDTFQNNAAADERTTTKEKANSSIKEKNELGRIKNAENSSFIFYPRTVLRSVDYLENSNLDSNKKLYRLVTALNKGSLGGIGPFEFNILEWIARLRYATSTMLLDLIKADYVSFGWRSDITQSKLAKIIKRMAEYDLIQLTIFVSLNDDGSLESTSSSALRVISLGRNGHVLLRELGKKPPRYNAFDIFQDGNTVKRFLTSNQWLIYWLMTYREEIGEEYETTYVIRLKGAEFIGAKLFATVTVNDCTMIAEPVRRTEDFEVESTKQALRDKLLRLSLIFDNMDYLYHDKDEISFPMRPIIVLICEDDSHIQEIQEAVRPVLPDIKDQEIWFTTDLRVFNYNMRGQRFLHEDNGTLQPVNLNQILGIDKEIKELRSDASQ